MNEVTALNVSNRQLISSFKSMCLRRISVTSLRAAIKFDQFPWFNHYKNNRLMSSVVPLSIIALDRASLRSTFNGDTHIITCFSQEWIALYVLVYISSMRVENLQGIVS